MVYKSVQKLPTRAKNMFNAIYEVAKKSVADNVAAKTALQLVNEHYKPIPSNGKKSLTAMQSYDDAQESKIHGTYIDVLLGYPGMDVQALNGGLKLGDDGWSRVPSGVLKGDFEHLYSNKADGAYIDIDEAWDGWVPVSQKFWYDEEGLHARVELPQNHDQNDEFLKMWNEKKLGLSVDYAYPEDAVYYIETEGKIIPEAKEWFITGFTFTEEPSYEKTKEK
jgi:hypothetical protein